MRMSSRVACLLSSLKMQLPTASPSAFTVAHTAEVAFPPSADGQAFASSVTVGK